MVTYRSLSLTLIATLVLAAGAGAQQVDNPNYLSWVSNKPGTKVSLRNEMSMQGMAMTQVISQTLKEIKPDKAVIETAMTMDMGGFKQDNKRDNEVPAKVEKGQELLPPETKGTVKEVGKETVEIAGKKYECTVYEFTGQVQQGTANGKFWRTLEIPGGLARMEMTMDAGGSQGTMKMIVTAVEKK